MTFEELQQDVYEDTGANNPAPAPSTVERIAKNINKAHRMVLTDSALTRLRRTGTPITFDSEDDRYLYGLPQSLESVLAISERDTNRRLTSKTIQEIREEDPGFTRQDTPWAFSTIGYKPVKRQPASTGLWAASSSSSDTTQTAQAQGVRASAAIATDTPVSLNGVTRVAIGTLTDYVDVISFTVSSTCAGVISLYDDASAGNQLAEIPIGHLSSQYLMIQLYPTPSATVTYYVDGIYRIQTLREAQDVPQVPDAFHDLLSLYAKEQESVKATESQRAIYYRGAYEEMMKKLRHWVATQGAEVPVVARRQTPRHSRYGAWCPPGQF